MYLPDSIATAKGHICQEFKGIQQTQSKQQIERIRARIEKIKANAAPSSSLLEAITNDIDADLYPASDSPNIRSDCTIYSIVENSPTGLSYTALTGWFPYRSAQGNEYILVAYNYDANSIYAVLIKNR